MYFRHNLKSAPCKYAISDSFHLEPAMDLEELYMSAMLVFVKVGIIYRTEICISGMQQVSSILLT